ncbi:choline transporter-like 2 isoform X1 [Spodoptera frugiperda]|uniref:Choline transporter-like protein n=2 Tax=Spodoptera frugiperda TaxID=7108 RepID=A0A9R0EW71_SPOFR|nr:choline transporter-like 2 isoform X1 [Spodoptera frugiperda]XP_050553340.1 choline transporter-like 2 isoform X1 [Spodoptera frugiperda]
MGCCIPPKESREPIRYDPNFNGPIHNRSCTDIFWLVLFVLFLGVWGYVGYYGMTHGNIEKLLAPIDTFGARCGLDSSVKDKPYLVFFDISKCLSPGTPIVGCPTPQVCVSKCPSRTIIFASEMNQQNFDTYRSSMVCTYDVNVNTISYSQAVEYMANGKCAPYVLESQAVLSRCIGDLSTLQCQGDSKSSPKTLSKVTDSCVRNPSEARKSLVNRATALDSYVGWIVASWMSFFRQSDERETHILSAQIVQDLVQSRWYLLGAVFGVVVLCFLYILLLRWVVGPVVWVSIVGLIGLLGFCVYLCYKNYAYYKANPGLLHQTTNLKGYAESMFTKPGTWMAILIAVAIVLLILVLMVIFLRKRISIAIAIIREGSKAVTAVKSTIFFPLFPWMFQCFVIAYGVLVLMYLLSIGDSAFKIVNLQNDTTCSCSNGVYSQDYQSCDPVTFLSHCFDSSGGSCKQAMCHFTGLENPHSVVYLHLANLLGFFWTMFFISGVSDMMLASTFSTWYWTYDKKDLPFFTLTSGIYRTVRFHLGTVAFGALIIAIVRVIRVILEYIDQKLKKFDNPVTKCLMCLCKCFCWCLENFLKFINKNAYIMCAVHGQNFCTSARDAFSLLMRNILRVVVIDKVTDFLFFLSKLLISIGVGVGVYYLLQWNLLYEVTKGQPLHYNHIPAIILSIATYLICTIFFNVYEMAVDTLFLCFLEDCERNDGSPEKPYFMSKNLMRILGKRNKEL